MKKILMALLVATLPLTVLAQAPVVVISDFEDRSGKGMNLGHKVREEITNLLVRLPHVQIVERQRMDKILEEMKFSRSAYVDADTAAAFGKKAGADLVIFGSVANASYSTALKERYSLTKGKFQEQRGSSQVNVNISIVDVETNQTTFSQSEVGKASGETDPNTVIPLATSDAVDSIAEGLQAQFPVKGYVIKKDQKNKDYLVYLDAGTNYGLEKGRKVLIYGQGETVVHPVTGEVLSSSKGGVISKATITQANEKFSIAEVNKKEFPEIELAMPFEVVPAGGRLKGVSGMLKGLGLD